MNTKNKDRVLYYLEELSNYKVSDSQKDVRGWVVHDAVGRTIGHVDNLLVNKNTERVVYLDVEVDESIVADNFVPYSTKTKDGVHDFINELGETHIIIPIGMATLNIEKEIVSTKEIDYASFAHTKRLKKGTPVYRDYEVDIVDNYTKPENRIDYPEDDTFYNRDEFGNK